MSKAHEKLVADQFGPRAKAYVESAVHSQGEDSRRSRRSSSGPSAHAIDLGAGGGHVSYLMARYAKSVTALDLSSEMLAAVAATAKERGSRTLRPREAAPRGCRSRTRRSTLSRADSLRITGATSSRASARLDASRRQARPLFSSTLSRRARPCWTRICKRSSCFGTVRTCDYTVAEWLSALGGAASFCAPFEASGCECIFQSGSRACALPRTAPARSSRLGFRAGRGQAVLWDRGGRVVRLTS